MTLKITEAGRKRLEGDLSQLEDELSAVLLEKAEAAEVGGNAWHDNASFEDAERRERSLRVRIANLRDRLSRARLVEPATGNSDTVEIGSTVVIELDDGSRRTITVGGHGESDPQTGLVSCESPIGSSLLHARAEERRTFIAGGSERAVRIKEIL